MTNLYNQKKSIEFYENRYEQGYMEEWPTEKKIKIFKIIQDLQLPVKGEVLDFGCGNGVLTEVIHQALPGWRVYGTDVSEKALSNAKIKFPSCTFFEENNPNFNHKKFDFIFTHHVFEHVFNLNDVFDGMGKYLKQESFMLHFLPCGNEDSYEYNICILRKDGINPDLENRFFFEDLGHVRRLTTNELCNLCKTQNFELQKEFYSNQYYGAINWITSSNPKFVLMFSDASQAVNGEAKQKLKKERIKLFTITAFRLPAQVFTKIFTKKKRPFKYYIIFLLSLPFLIFSIIIDNYYKIKTTEEWNKKKHDRNGSEMSLFFKR